MQAIEFGSARSSSYPISAFPRPVSRLPRVDGIDDMVIDDAVEVIASAMGSSNETVIARAVTLRPLKQSLQYETSRDVSEADYSQPGRRLDFIWIDNPREQIGTASLPRKMLVAASSSDRPR